MVEVYTITMILEYFKQRQKPISIVELDEPSRIICFELEALGYLKSELVRSGNAEFTREFNISEEGLKALDRLHGYFMG